jgi:hypothetical protein
MEPQQVWDAFTDDQKFAMAHAEAQRQWRNTDAAVARLVTLLTYVVLLLGVPAIVETWKWAL